MRKIKLMMKVFIYINALFFITFYLIPSNKVFASFTDSDSLNAGIKLTLGNLDLSSEQNETTTGLTYLGGDPVLLSSHILKNIGTLDGKLAYKIQVTEKGTTIPVNDSGTQLMIKFDSVIGDKIIPASKINSADYTFVTDNENNEWIFDGDPEKDVSVPIEYKTTTVPEKDRDIDITVTFLLVQTNASEPKETMFYDKISFKHELRLKAEKVPDPNYWPAADDENWKFNGKVRYYDEQFENIMYFSELESGDRVRNLNDNVIYIELPEGKMKENKNFDINQQLGSNVKVEIMENKRFIKLTYSFEKSMEEAESLLSQPGYQSVSFKYGPKENPDESYIQFDSNILPLIHKRIVLSSDQDVPGNFKPLTIYSTKEQQNISFKHITKNDSVITTNSNLDQPQNLTEAKLNYKNLEAIVSEEPTLFDLKLYKADQIGNQHYLSISPSEAAKPSNKKKIGKLKIIITGNTGNRLVIYRDLSNDKIKE